MAVIVSCALNVAAAGQGECLIYAEGFESFSGPHDLDDGTHRVQWCDNGASIAGGSFCPSGNALRLNGPTDDPLVFVAAPKLDCTSYTIEFEYSQFADTSTVLRYAIASAPEVNCGQSVTTGAVALTTLSGQCTPVSHTVNVAAGQAVYWRFDHGSNTNAIFIDNVTVTVGGCCDDDTVHGCCELGAAGCSDSAIEQCVCAVDPFCCDTQWDQLCVDEVESLDCGSCAPAPTCIGDFTIDFGSLFEPGGVCGLFPHLFAECQGTGPFISSGTACGASGDMAMTFASGFPYSAAITHCIDLSEAAIVTLDFSYTKNTGSLGPQIDISTDGETFTPIWSGPVVFTGKGCENISLDLSSLAGESEVRLRFSSGSSVSNGAAFDDIALQSSDIALHECCETGPAGCVDSVIQECVCAIDPFCCETEWDDLCVVSVEYYQCGDCGFCVEDYSVDGGDEFTGGAVCDLFPELLLFCDGSGPWLTTGTACGGDGDPAILFGSGAETSAFYSRCLDLVGLMQAALQFSYTKIDGTVGPIVEVSLDAAGTFVELWRAPPSPGAGCHSECIDLTAVVGHPFVILRFRAGSASTVGSAVDDIQLLRELSCPLPDQPPDINDSGAVDLFDLLMMLDEWGPCEVPGNCPADLNNSGEVDLFDLLDLLDAWGPVV